MTIRNATLLRAQALAVLAVLMLAVLLVPAAHAQTEDTDQEAEADSVALGDWALDLAGKLSASQAAFSNWTEGGINTLALTTGLNGKARRTTEDWQQTYDARFAFGFVRQDTLEVRKADDVIKLAAALQYRGSGFFRTFNPTVAAEARTQFAAGFNHDEVPEELGLGRSVPVKVSDFFAPATFTESLGLTYEPTPWLTQRFGVAGKQTVVAIERLRPVYGLRLDQRARIEAGLESKTEVDREVFTNVRFKSTLGLFAAFNQTDELPDLTWENIVTMQVNRYLSVDFEFTTLYDRDISPDAQIKEVLSVGVSFFFI